MLLGTAAWTEGPRERRALVARLASGRVVDLNRIEAIRLGKLGEGDPEGLAAALVPPSLRRVLEGGPRALARARQAVAYAEKWDRRGTLPEALCPAATLLPCLPRPLVLRRADGAVLDRLSLRGPGALLAAPPQPTLAVLGQAGGTPAGYALVLEAGGVLLGAWMTDTWPGGSLELRVGATRRSTPCRIWEGLDLPLLHPGEVRLLPPPRLKLLPDLLPGVEARLSASFDTLSARLDPEGTHPTVQ